MLFKGIIFDFNGVLWWDKELQEGSWNKFAISFRDYAFSKAELDVHVHGRTNSHTLTYLSGHSLTKADLAVLVEQKEAIYREMCLEQGDGLRLSPGAVDLLNFLVDHQINRSIATATVAITLNFFVQHLELERWFQRDQIVYDDGMTPGKPAPDLFLKAAQNLGLLARECVVIEDSLSGIQAAHAAGIGHIVALSPAQHQTQFEAIEGVNAVVEDLSQIPREELFLQSRH
jgi:beta-phosphoglucomutase-like phosphatase (HAD superfamily)